MESGGKVQGTWDMKEQIIPFFLPFVSHGVLANLFLAVSATIADNNLSLSRPSLYLAETTFFAQQPVLYKIPRSTLSDSPRGML